MFDYFRFPARRIYGESDFALCVPNLDCTLGPSIEQIDELLIYCVDFLSPVIYVQEFISPRRKLSSLTVTSFGSNRFQKRRVFVSDLLIENFN